MHQNMDKRDYDRFRKKLSFVATCQTKAKALEQKLNSCNVAGSADKICIGFHIRHVFDTEAPSVGLNIDPDNEEHEANKTIVENRKYGLQTLNHVLDTLYYKPHGNSQGSTDRRKNSNQPKKLCIYVNFAQPHTSECHVFDRIPPPEATLCEDAKKWKICHYGILKDHIFPEDKDKIRDFASGVIDLPWKQPPPEGSRESDALQPKRSLFDDFACGAEKLCNDLGIDHSLLAYRVITAALYQLGTYTIANADNGNLLFGSQTVTFIIRSESPFSIALGVTVIAETITPEMVEHTKNFLECTWKDATSKKGFLGLFGWADNAITDILWGKDWYTNRNISHDIANMAEYLSEFIRRSNEGDSTYWHKELKGTLMAFVDTLGSFCGERLEGRPICFGLILGNPGLLTHTPREQPFPLEYEDTKGKEIYKFFLREKLPKQVHLAAMPSERAVVIPFCSPPSPSGASGKLAAFALEFDEAMDEFRARPWSRLWSEQYIPYLYYTERFPWAFAGFVGPGAEIRLFVNGKLVAYHYEKGWRKIDVERAMKDDKLKNVKKAVVRQLLEVAFQMSRFSNPHAKGGMLIYISKPPNSKVESHFQSLTDNEPLRRPKTPWLTRSCLIRAGKLDYAVARTVLQAAHLDGAIVLSKSTEECSVKVHSFGQRVVKVPQKSTGPKSGSRHAAAEALMEVRKIPPGSFVISVSSDGPVTIWTKSKSGSSVGSVEIGEPL